jgi:hypothetical protein
VKNFTEIDADADAMNMQGSIEISSCTLVQEIFEISKQYKGNGLKRCRDCNGLGVSATNDTADKNCF